MLPDWIDFAFSENTAARIYRGLSGPPKSWGELIAVAQAILGFYQEHPLSEHESLFEEGNIVPLIAASRILDTAARPQVEIAEEERRNIGLMAAIAFSMYGNFPSSAAVLRSILPSLEEISPSLAVAIATCAPEHIGWAIPLCPSRSRERKFLEGLEYFLTTGNTSVVATLRKDFIRCLIGASSPFESSLLRSVRLSLEHVLRLSAARNLHEFCPALLESYPLKLVSSGIRMLLPPQYRALAGNRLARGTANALVSLPTSTGKTLLGEICLMSALGTRPGLGCYVAPYVALGRQVAESFRRHLPESVRVHPWIGGYQEPEHLEPSREMEIVVATPERFDAMCRNSPHLIDNLRYVVFDEAHLVENDSRGIRMEGLVTRLRLMQESGHPVRLMLLSAVLADYEALRSWANVPAERVVIDSWRPTARRLAFWKQEGRLVWYMAGDTVKPSGASPRSVLGQMSLPWPAPNLYVPRNFPQIKIQKPLVYANVAYLCNFLWLRYTGPVLCVCASKDDTRQLAFALASHFPETEILPPPITGAIEHIESTYPFLRPLGNLLRRGIAYHNAGLPHKVRELIEACAKAGVLRVVTSTTTLAEGVDLPFRFTIIVDWLVWRGDRQQPMSGLLFRNVAGRCGRAGIYTEGDTVVFDNLLGDANYTHPAIRSRIQERVFLSAESAELKSAMEDGVQENDEYVAAFASQFMASIPENPQAEDLPSAFARRTLWAFRDRNQTRVVQMFRRVTDSLLDEERGALARAASPLQLTDFGKAANSTGFSPDSCRRIVAFLRSPVGSASIANLSGRILRELGTLPEQTNRELKKIIEGQRTQFRVKSEDIERVIEGWLNGQKREEIFAGLPSVQNSTISPSINHWLEGQIGAQKWDEHFDKFTEFTKAVIEEFLPWVIRACSRLNAFAGGWSVSVDWGDLARRIQNPVEFEE